MTLPTTQKATNTPAMSREAIRANATKKLAEIAGKKDEAPKGEPAPSSEAQAEPEKAAAAAAMVEPAGEKKEEAKAEVPAPEKKEDPLTPKPEKPTSDAMLAYYREQAKLKADRESLEKERADLAVKKKEQAEDDAFKKKDPFAWAQKHGVDYEAWTARKLNGGERTPEEIAQEIVEKRIAEYEAKQEERREKDRQQREAKEQSEAIQKWDSALSAIVAEPPTGRPDKYRLIRVFGWEAMAKTVIYNQLKEDQAVYGERARPLTNEEALARVEKYLEERHTKALDKATTVPADKQSAAPQKKEEPKVTQGGSGSSPRTLDPDSPASPPPNLDDEAKLSPEEKKLRRRQKALAKLG